jgi:hypothetical protein
VRNSGSRVAALAVTLLASRAGAQDLAKRITTSDGTVNVVYPSRPSVCGDGQSFVSDLFGTRRYFTDGEWTDMTQRRACVHGPARAMATVIDGEVTRVKLFVGPIPTAPADARTISVSANEAQEWLSGLALRGSSRAASDAIPALVVADVPDPWPLLLRIARNEDRPRNVRSSALTWLSTGVSDHLGIAQADQSETDDDKVREQAVFALSQRPKGESVPELIDIARTARNAAARRAAIFWLGQTGDRRAADVYAELLGVR